MRGVNEAKMGNFGHQSSNWEQSTDKDHALHQDGGTGQRLRLHVIILVTDLVNPAHIETSAVAGRCGLYCDGRWARL